MRLKDGRSRGGGVRQHREPSRRGPDLAALRARASGTRPRGRSGERRRRPPEKTTTLSSASGKTPIPTWPSSDGSPRGVRSNFSRISSAFQLMSSLHQRAKDLFLEALDRPEGGSRRIPRRGVRRRRRPAPGGRVAAGVSRRVRAVRSRRPDGASFAPGEVFAGRYRMVTRIGRGGMGDVWRADDLVLDTPVALKLIAATGPVGRDRILNEVRLARQITHPAVCRVFDVGESGESDLLLDGAGRRRGPRVAASSRRPAAVGHGHRHRAPAVRRPRGRARAGRAASRSQARPTS